MGVTTGYQHSHTNENEREVLHRSCYQSPPGALLNRSNLIVKTRSGAPESFYSIGRFCLAVPWPNQIGKTVEFDGKTPTDQPPYRLVKSDGDAYAFYFAKLEFGFGKGLEIQVYEAKRDPKKRLVGVKWMAGNSFGLTPEGRARTASDPLKMNWQIVREAF